jgi:hypothetical protein
MIHHPEQVEDCMSLAKRIIPIIAVFIIIGISRGAFPESAVYLEGLYATSTAFDYIKNGPQHLFDGKPDCWVSMPGTAPDEGVMLYFEAPTPVGRVEIVLPASSDYAKISRVRVYANGTDLGAFNMSDQIRINTAVSSLYLRIDDVEGLDKKEVTSDIQGMMKGIKRFNSSKSAAISELKLFDSKNQPMQIIPPKLFAGSIKPSSTLAPEEAYHAGYLFDSRRDSGWVEGNKKSGTGESIAFKFSQSATIAKVKIWNGLLISSVHYSANERVKSFTFDAKDGGKVYSIPDSMKPQTVTLEKPLTGNDFVFTIKGIYPGTTYKDTVISEILFNDGTQWFNLYSGEVERRKKNILDKIRGTLLEGAVDHYLFESYEDGPSYKTKSLILRSDSSFVIYLEDSDEDSQSSARKTRILDGFWNIISVTGNKVTVNIMGRNYNLSEQYMAYQGDKKSSAVSIFSDTLTITKGSIKGAKFFGSIGL